MAKKHKTFYLVGIDSAALWILKRLKDRKGFEAFSKLLDRNLITDLESTLLPLTAPSWSTIYTGLEPRQHGVPEFLVVNKDYVLDVAYFKPSETPPFYYTLAKSGFKCLVITPAMDTDLPPQDIRNNLDIITGFPLKPKTNSKRLGALMKKYGFEGEPDIENDFNNGRVSEAELANAYASSIRKRALVAENQMKESDYEFVYVCFTETDRIQHFMINKPDSDKYLLEIYSEISNFIDYLMCIVDERGGALAIVSDHGSQYIRNEFLVNSWLIANKYATLKEPAHGKEDSKKSESGGASTKYKLREALMHSGLRNLYERMPYFMKRLAFEVFSLLSSSVNSSSYNRILLSDLDMKKTKLFGAITVLPVSTIWINDDRFSKGTVKRNEKEQLKKELIKKLSSIRDDEENKLIVKVIDGQEYYKGIKKFIPPDIIFEVEPNYTVDPYHLSRTSFFMKPTGPKIGDHSRYGIFGYYAGGNTKLTARPATVSGISKIILGYFGVKADI